MSRGERGPHGDHGQPGDPGRIGEKGDTGAKGERGDREHLPLAVRYATVAWLIMAAGVVGMGAWLYYDNQADKRAQVERDKAVCAVATHNRADLNLLKDSLRRAYTLPFIPKPSSDELMQTVPPDRPPVICNGKVNLTGQNAEEGSSTQQGP